MVLNPQTTSPTLVRPPADRRIYHYIPSATDLAQPPMGGLNPYHRVYIETGDQILQQLLAHGRLCPTSKVLEIGCGTGRVARPLLNYLKDGHYDGFDLNRAYIEYCRQQFPGADFNHFDFPHDEFNPTGILPQESYCLPYRARSYDLVLAIAVFNHCKTAWAINYIREASKLLKPRGILLVTALLLNQASLQFIHRRTDHPWLFEMQENDTWYEYDHRPYFNTAQPEIALRQACIKHGLMIKEPISYGHWRGCHGLAGHDTLIAIKGQWN